MDMTEFDYPRVRRLPRVRLPNDLRAKALAFALGPGINNCFTMRGRILASELLIGKLGEIAAYLWFGQRVPDEIFSDRSDGGWDIEVAGFRIDVKGSDARHYNLIWPASKVGDYPNRQFHLLMSVSIFGKARDQACIDGVISKAMFEHHKLVATGDGCTRPRLDRGTWYLNKESLQQLADSQLFQNRIDDLQRKCAPTMTHATN